VLEGFRLLQVGRLNYCWPSPAQSFLDTAYNSSFIVARVSVAVVTWAGCLGNTFTEPLPSNGCLFWLCYPGFQQTCYNILICEINWIGLGQALAAFFWDCRDDGHFSIPGYPLTSRIINQQTASQKRPSSHRAIVHNCMSPKYGMPSLCRWIRLPLYTVCRQGRRLQYTGVEGA
jgi:hypothetical protein